ncbi:1-deoxy-D-xylulose-5-phosphate synthase [Actinosynnema mirum]|uniref:1-deoxy-D-xylulose-5-phosphate synthase n=1 Tax=Actinosynnema mirum (strain ATCC 29888 / DSM 43827 / JCM 3225 / NBRC 14064 / NCIMB 13271 / NRRL B-12336 / IMRU 3971 / 101) TaxID=446462 RepID=C6WS23_ACTMD|nr:Transketolase central region [Actinosynnema mirum DSM 43827]
MSGAPGGTARPPHADATPQPRSEALPTSLEQLTGPEALRAVPERALPALAAEIRRFLVEKVSRRGGHLGSNLGVVELTIALHRVFDSPHDVLLFDGGHQSYAHKVLTGRAAGFDGLRGFGGLSGYPSAAESQHDVVENSHSSTALSYADGIARALRLQGSDRRVVAVVGDGALTGGMAWEALNNLASADYPVIVVVNDNARSYAPTAGGLAAHLGRLRERRAHPVFEELGLPYLGPVDGHDVPALEGVLAEAAALGRPVVVHCATRKGRGYPPAEGDAVDCLHAVSPSGGTGERGWADVFGAELAEIGLQRADVVCVTAAVQGPSGLDAFARRFPERVFDVGVAEQHAVTSAAGMAMAGAHPVVPLASTFLQRAFDQVLMDVALHRLPVTLVLGGAGVTGPDGPSQQGLWDAALLPLVPGMRVAAPRDPARLVELLREAVAEREAPTALRHPSGPAPEDVPALRRVGGCDVLHEAHAARALLVAVGPMAGVCLEAAGLLAERGVGVDVVDPRWIAPLDPELLRLAGGHRVVLVVEDGVAGGSLGARLAQAVGSARVRSLALPVEFLPHGERAELLRRRGLAAGDVAAAVRRVVDEDSLTVSASVCDCLQDVLPYRGER